MNVMASLCNPKVAKQLRNLNENETLLSSESNIQSSRVRSPGAAIGVKRPRLDNFETVLETHLKLGLRRWLDKDSGSASSTIWSPKTVLYMDDVKLPVFVEGSHDCGSSDEREEEERKRVKRPKLDNLESELESHKESSVPLTEKVLCSHSTGIVCGMCVLRGQIMDKETGVKFECIQKESRLFDEEFVRLCIREKNRLVSHKKLCLVLDLDHTLLHTSKLVDMTPKEESCESLFMFDSLKIMTKLRPFVHNLLREASDMFEMYIYTMGNKYYALQMAKLLDPKDDYFTGRIISREDSTQEHQKSLNMVPVHESVVLILDDKEMVWTKHTDNLILMKGYNFFPPKGNQVGFNFKSLSEQNADESESGGALSAVLKVLKQIHSLYFEQVVVANSLDERDVREVLKGVRKVVLKDCRLVFSQVSSTKFQYNKQHLWKMAEQMGAICFTRVDERATHVISTSSRTTKSLWALKEKKFLVHPMWIETAYYFWQRQPEENFCIRKTKV